MGLKEGLYRKFKQAHGFYAIIAIATLLGLVINFTSLPPFKILYYTAVLNGLCAPPLILMILLLSNNKKIMGKYTNKKISNILGGTIFAIMALCALALIISFII